MAKNEYVIIGNCIAATGCVEGIREKDQEGHITIISRENHAAYARPLISYYLEGETNLELMRYRDADFYEKNNCTVIYGEDATKIDPDKKIVYTSSGKEFPYSSLCVATGSSPFVPPFNGLDTVECQTGFMTVDDSLYLEEHINEFSRVLIVGAGLIGLKCAEGIHGRAAKITVCDLAPRVLSSILDDECAGIMQKQLEDNGIEFMLGDSADSFDKNVAHMKSGKDVEFDVLVLAVGVRPNTSLISDIGGEVEKGIIVDKHLRTSIQDIYCAGDCSQGIDISSGQSRILAILPNAYMQGFTAGMNMTGANEHFEKSIPMNSIGFFGLHAMTAGSYYGEEDGGQLYEEKGEKSIKRLFTKDGYLSGFIIIGDVDKTGIYTSLIYNKVPLETLDYEMIKKHPSLMAFSKKARREKLGGVV